MAQANGSLSPIYLDPNMVPAALRGGYQGKKFKACVVESMTIPMTAGLWSGGSRDTYRVIRLADGAEIEPVNHNAAPWNTGRQDVTVELEPGIAVIEHSMFCGKDMGLTFYVHPDNAAKLLPAPTAELTVHERIVLCATASYKSSYGGMDRHDMAERDLRYGYIGNYHHEAFKAKPSISQEEWELAKANLIRLGLLNKAGAITPAGRNAVPSRGGSR